MNAATQGRSEALGEMEATWRLQAVVIRLPELLRTLGISRSTVYLKINPGSKYYDRKFPKPIKLGNKAVGWLLHDVVSYVNELKKGY